jgi:hypothetical protein
MKHSFQVFEFSFLSLYGSGHADPVRGLGMNVEAELPPDFRPGLSTRLRVLLAHARLHHILRRDLLRHGDVGQTLDCAHCRRRWILRRTQFSTYLREARQ